MEQFQKLYMFNPFTIENADSQSIGITYASLQEKLNKETDTPYQIAQNIEIYANMNFLLGEMIARIQREYDLLKTEISITENKQVYMQRKQWQETNTEKAPAMSYFEAMAKEYVKEDSKKLAELGSKLFRFKKAYESIEGKQNALKKKIEAIKYEI
jgi:hypothetical protein